MPQSLQQLKQNTEVGCGPEMGGLFGENITTLGGRTYQPTVSSYLSTGIFRRIGIDEK